MSYEVMKATSIKIYDDVGVEVGEVALGMLVGTP